MKEYAVANFALNEIDALNELQIIYWLNGMSTRVVSTQERRLVLFVTAQSDRDEWIMAQANQILMEVTK